MAARLDGFKRTFVLLVRFFLKYRLRRQDFAVLPPIGVFQSAANRFAAKAIPGFFRAKPWRRANFGDFHIVNGSYVLIFGL
jgi:hypothetical protein